MFKRKGKTMASGAGYTRSSSSNEQWNPQPIRLEEEFIIKNHPVINPVKRVGALEESMKMLHMDECGQDKDPEEMERTLKEGAKNNLDSVNFAEEIKIDFIPQIDFRIMCNDGSMNTY